MKKKLFILALIILLPIILIIFLLRLVFNYDKTDNTISADINTSNLTGQENQLALTGETQTGSLIAQDTNRDNKTLTVYIPEIFYNNGFLNMKKNIFKNTGIIIDFKRYDDIQQYQNDLLLSLAKGGENTDIFLIPTDWLDTFSQYGYKLQFKNDISTFFSYLFYDLLKDKDFTFLPYSIDPFVSIVNKNFYDKDEISLTALKEYILLAKQQSFSEFKVPILLGYSKYDISLLQNNNQVFPSYFLVLYNFIYQSVLSKNTDNLRIIGDFSNDQTFGVRDYVKFKKLVKKFSQTDKNCELFPAICVLSKGFADVNFGFLSDLNAYEKYFLTDRNGLSNFKIYNFPNSSETYLVRGWGFMINKDIQDLYPASVFIDEYLKTGTQDNISLWNNTFSAFNNIFDKQKLEKKYSILLQYVNKFSLLIGGVNMQSDFVKNTKFIDFLKGDYSMQAFIDGLDF